MNEHELMEMDQEPNGMMLQPQSGGLLDSNSDNILYLAEQAEKYIVAMNKIMDAALKITTERDWVLIGDGAYLQETGASKVARLFGISIQLVGHPMVEVDALGYKTFTYKARFHLKDQYVEAEGSRSMKEDFFAGKDNPEKGKKKKTPDEIDERDVKMAAYTNCLNAGIKRLIPGLRGLNASALERAGLNTKEIKGYTFGTGTKGGKSDAEKATVCKHCGTAVAQNVAAYSLNKFGIVLCRDCQKEV